MSEAWMVSPFCKSNSLNKPKVEGVIMYPSRIFLPLDFSSVLSDAVGLLVLCK